MGTSLKVDTTYLDELSSYLEESQSKVSQLLTQMKTKMGGLSACWTDSAGTDFVNKFNSFITESEKLSLEIGYIKTFLDSFSTYYTDTETQYLKALGD